MISDRINTKAKMTILLLSVILSTAQVFGCNLSLEYNTSVHSHLEKFLLAFPNWLWVIIWLAEVAAFYFSLRALFHFLGRVPALQVPKYKKQKGIFIILLGAVGIFVCWLPILYANLPGFFNYDISGQLIQVMYADLNDYNTHHSLASTLFMGGIITLGYQIYGDLLLGIQLYSYIQMLLCAITFAYSLYFIYKKTNRMSLVIIGFLFYAFSPTIAMFAMSTTKDVICSLFVLLASLLVFEMLEDTKKFFSKPMNPVFLALALILASMFRKNIIYAIILFAIACVMFIKDNRKHAIILFAATLIGFFVSSAALEKALDAKKGGAAEAYSIPIQQIGFIYATAGESAFTEDELNIMYSMVSPDGWTSYNPFISDNIKNAINVDCFTQHKGEFLSLWIKKGLQYPRAYLKAFLNLTYQAWYPGTSISQGQIYYFDFEGLNYRIEKTSYFPDITEFCRKISLEFHYQKVPVVRLLFSNGFMFWVLLVTAFKGIYTKQKMVWGTVLLALCVSLTCLAGPVSLIRYYLILFYAFPVYLALLFYQTRSDKMEVTCDTI